MDLMIRDARTEDYEGVLNLLGQLWPSLAIDPVRMREVYDRCLHSPQDYMYCAFEDSRLAAFGAMTIENIFWLQSRAAYITTLIVDEASRGRGIGRAMIDRMSAVAAAEDCARIELDSGFHREAAHRFYESLGFDKRAYRFSKPLD